MDIKHTDENPIYFDTFEEKDLKNVIDTQEGIIKYMIPSVESMCFYIKK